MQARYPNLDFLQYSENWDYETHTSQAATKLAERVRKLLRDFTSNYQSMPWITHRGLLAFMVQGARFEVCGKCSHIIIHFRLLILDVGLETRSYHFAKHAKVAGLRYGTNVDTQAVQDFGPTFLKECGKFVS
jgi:hypothetical protein